MNGYGTAPSDRPDHRAQAQTWAGASPHVAQAHATIYVGDQLARIADSLEAMSPCEEVFQAWTPMPNPPNPEQGRQTWQPESSDDDSPPQQENHV